MTALDIARAVQAGERSAVSVVEEHLAAIDAREAELHACNLVMRDSALAEAAAIDARVAAGETVGPLAGVPVALKDNMCTRGVATTCSSKILEGWHPPYDAEAVIRLRAAGAIPIAKTNLDEFAMGSSTETSAFGPVKNPWRAKGSTAALTPGTTAQRLVAEVSDLLGPDACVVPALDLTGVARPTTIGLGDSFVGGFLAALDQR